MSRAGDGRRAGTSPAGSSPPSAGEIGDLARAFVREAAGVTGALTKAVGLHPTDAVALHALDMAAAHQPTMGELGRLLALSSPAVTELVDRLEAAGLARRVPDAVDRRRVRVALTEHAAEVGAELLAPLAQRIDVAARRLDGKQRAAVGEFLRAVLQRQPAAALEHTAS